MKDSTTKYCACGCGQELPKPKFPSRKRKYIAGHSATKGKHFIRKSLKQRFWEKVNIGKPDECWEWTAYKDKDGYGQIRLGHKRDHANTTAHRVSYELNFGGFDESFLVCHTCDNPSCVNPNHLFLGSHDDNVQDMIQKGRKRCAKGEVQHAARLTANDVIAIRKRYVPRKVTMYQLADEYGVTPGHICDIIHRKAWRHIK